MNSLELARARSAWCLYDWANSAFATVILAAVLPVYFASLVPPEGAHIPGMARTLPATALWGYTVSLSMLLVALPAPWLGAQADRGGHRRTLLIVFGGLGAVATCLLVLAGPGDYLLAAVLFILANIGFAAGNIFYNAFLPDLASGIELDRLSSRGYAIGYVGGGLALLLVFLLIQGYAWIGLPDRGGATRAGFLLTGLWWGLFALPAFRHLHDAPGGAGGRSPLTLRAYLATFAALRRYRDLLLFLLAFLCYNDGIQTMIAVTGIFAREELGLPMTTILLVFLMIQFVAWPAALIFGRMAARYGAKPALFGGLVLFLAVTIYASSMSSVSEFWLLGFAVALILGGCQAISRSLYATFVPPGKSAEFFSFFAISGKFASIFGPLLFAMTVELTGSTRFAILAIAVLFAAGLLLLALVDVPRGQALARTAVD